MKRGSIFLGHSKKIGNDRRETRNDYLTYGVAWKTCCLMIRDIKQHIFPEITKKK